MSACAACRVLEEKDAVIAKLTEARKVRKSAHTAYDLAFTEATAKGRVLTCRKLDAANAFLADAKLDVARCEARLEQLDMDRTYVSHTCNRE